MFVVSYISVICFQICIGYWLSVVDEIILECSFE